jgi:integrase
VQGWPQRTTIGPFPDLSVENARGKAHDLNAKLSRWKANNYEGPGPLVERRTRVPTLGEVLEHYCEHHLKANAKNGATATKYARWQVDFYLASWRNRPLSSISRKDIRDKHSALGTAHGQFTANRVVTFVRALFNHAIHPDIALWEGANPARNPKKFLFHEQSRERTIERGEAPKFFKQLANEPHRDLRDFVLLALSIGARRGSILSMRWDQIDWQRGLWTIPNPKSRKKNAKPHILPLTKFAVAVLKARADGSEWVFPGKKKERHLTTIKKPWARFLKRTGIGNLRIHDLRRTLATAEGDTGASTELIQKTLGHTEDSAATRIYDRSQRHDDVRGAMDAAFRSQLAAGKMPKRKLLKAANP